MLVPGYWSETPLGPMNGVVWFRRDFDLHNGGMMKNATLILGRIVDSDSVYLNGVFVGTTGYQYPPRRYDIPVKLLKQGTNTLVVRVISNSGKGGFVPDKQYELKLDDGRIDLKGNWLYKAGAKMDPLPATTNIRMKPGGLYNAMINPLLKFRIKGVIWYQGESNADRAVEYRQLFPAVIRDWRNNFDQGDFPFLFVQLANFMESKDQPSESNWAMLREAQLKTLTLPNTGMAVAIDVGEWNDIHPLNKKDVGLRLALAAGRIAYKDEKPVYSGPLYLASKIAGNMIIVSFNNTGSGLVAKNSKSLKGFAICGEDKVFVWAETKIANNKVLVWNENIPKPVAVRYAWADNPDSANLYNKEGLPAAPFRTDE